MFAVASTCGGEQEDQERVHVAVVVMMLAASRPPFIIRNGLSPRHVYRFRCFTQIFTDTLSTELSKIAICF